MSKIRLITGGIGTGKSLWTVEELFKEQTKDTARKIFTDITGIKNTGIEKAPDDWRTIPNNSLVVYDEVQYRDLFSRHNSKRDKQILDLTTIRKRGIEMWLITQRARFLNADVLGLVNEHVHLERVGQKISNVYIFQEAELNITKTKKMFAFEKYRWVHPEHLFGFYESIQPDAKHNKRSYLNKGIVAVVLTLVLALIAGVIFVRSATKQGISSNGVETKKPDKQYVQPVPTSTNNQAQAVQDSADLSIECRKGENVEKPECVNWFNQISKRETSVSTGEHGQTVISYDPEKPFQKQAMTYQVKTKPVFSGCMKLNGKYVAYTQQGTILDGVSQSDCKRVIENGERPFNYFSEQKQNTVTGAVGTDQEKLKTMYENKEGI
ncbi:P-loop NTPase family protein [Acinetobacter pollinis]|uniref:zonular occludens toxin domain-containing protein n=1 Tax=Acinetobacter pollinis TaxID=2605270 RepID=UPI0018A2DC3F|nr:zonular occludens toxin domain-containing protein [Acinetobacter pollinis]MBF7691730.1 hypothetical protein [Acinetobacter pollinis]MBF7699363.1 hypothetical protein [Acinetobacter pollinis]